MTLISGHGNKAGYSVVEAAVALFIAGTLLLTVIGFSAAAIKVTKNIIQKNESYIYSQNEYSKKSLENNTSK